LLGIDPFQIIFGIGHKLHDGHTAVLVRCVRKGGPRGFGRRYGGAVVGFGVEGGNWVVVRVLVVAARGVVLLAGMECGVSKGRGDLLHAGGLLSFGVVVQWRLLLVVDVHGLIVGAGLGLGGAELCQIRLGLLVESV
jgi:hypothetical protein